eukprot:gene17256-19674_t
MGILSGLYRAVSDKDLRLFETTLQKALFIVFVLAFLKAISNYCNDLCAIRWRAYLVEHIHGKYAQYSASVQNGSGKDIDTKDQRITQDIDRLTTKAAKLVADVIVLPAVVEQLEGEFRQSHCLAQQHEEEVYLLRGEAEETRRMQMSFKLLLENSYTLVTRRFWVNVCTHWFAYAGAIVNYVVVGVAIFVLHDADMNGNEEGGSGADRVALLAQGSYACMYLISALSTILNSSESASEVAGLVRRVSELLDRLCENNSADEKVARSLVGSAAAGTVWSPLRLNSGSRETAGTETTYQPLRTSEESDCFVSSRSQNGQGIEMGDIVGLTRSLVVSQDDLQSPASFQSKSTPMTVIRLENLDVLCEKNTNEEVVDPFSERRLPSRRLLVRDLTLEVRQGMRVLITG